MTQTSKPTIPCTCWCNRTPHPFNERTCANETHPDRKAETPTIRMCPCENLPGIGLNYPCVITVDGRHVYAPTVDLRPMEVKP